MRLYGRVEHVEQVHGPVVGVGIVLHHFHGFQLFQPGFLGDLVFAFVGIVLQVPDIRDVAYIAYFVFEVLQVADCYRVKTMMISNGMLLDDEVCRWMTADQSLWRYLVSFDGSTKTTLEAIRRGANFEKIVENVTNTIIANIRNHTTQRAYKRLLCSGLDCMNRK